METASVNKILQLFNRLSKPEQMEIAERIDKQTFEDRWQQSDITLPNADFSDDDVINEVRAVHYGSKKD